MNNICGVKKWKVKESGVGLGNQWEKLSGVQGTRRGWLRTEKWSWDRILRNTGVKQREDTLGFLNILVSEDPQVLIKLGINNKSKNFTKDNSTLQAH